MASKKAPDVVVAGHICLDIIPDITHMSLASAAEFFKPGVLLNAAAATVSTGGPVSNTGLGMVKFGIDTALMGKVGQDPFGHIIQILLKEGWGITGGMILAEGATTSYTIVINPPGFDRMFMHCPGANNTFCAADVDYEMVARARLFHLGYPPLMERMYSNGGAELVEIFRRVKDLGVTTSLDMSLPDPTSPSGKVDWAALCKELIEYVDLFLPSAEEALFMLDRPKFDAYRAPGRDMIDQFTGDDLHALSETLREMGAKIVCIKAGHRGLYLRTADAETLAGIGKATPGDADAWAGRELWHPAFQIEGEPKATGSGDSAIAGFLAAYIRGHTPAETLAYANGTGAFNIMKPDALSGIPEWDTLVAAVAAGWDPEPLTVTGKGWRRAEGLLWHGPAEKQ